ncbi:MAG: hypothetical protein Fur0046_03440 [Cyanobacteria bacterium J069]
MAGEKTAKPKRKPASADRSERKAPMFLTIGVNLKAVFTEKYGLKVWTSDGLTPED